MSEIPSPYKPVELPHHPYVFDAFGNNTVRHVELGLSHEMNIDALNTLQATHDELVETKLDPRKMSRTQKLANVLMRSEVMTTEDMNTVDDVYEIYTPGLIAEEERGRDRNDLYRETDIADDRQRLRALTPDQKAEADAIVRMNRPPQILVDAHQKSRGDQAAGNFVEWLTEESSDDQFLNFLQWHNHAIEQKQVNPELQDAINNQKATYKQGLMAAVNDGWLHPDANNAPEAVDATGVKIGDIFSTVLQRYGGYAPQNRNFVVIADADQRRSNVQKVEQVLTHELNHATVGSFPDRWLNEAATEHISEVLKNPQEGVDYVQPFFRYKDSGVYASERHLLGQLLTTGSLRLSGSLVTRAYSERDPEGEAHQALNEALSNSWQTPDILQKVSRLIADLEGDVDHADGKGFEKQNVALSVVTQLLDEHPEVIFGTGYIKPERKKEIEKVA